MAANNSKKSKRIYLILFILYLVLLFYFLFFSEGMGRLETDANYRYNITLFREIKRFYVYRDILGYKAFFFNVFGNIIAFLPFGMLLPKIYEHLKHGVRVTILALELSLLVEIIQLVFKLGSFDVDDILLNTLGGLIGYFIYFIFDGSRKRNVSDE